MLKICWVDILSLKEDAYFGWNDIRFSLLGFPKNFTAKWSCIMTKYFGISVTSTAGTASILWILVLLLLECKEKTTTVINAFNIMRFDST